MHAGSSGGAAQTDIVRITSEDGATAEVHRNGAHVTSWKPATDHRERLFLSSRTGTGRGIAIRGGIPVIFPQFASEGPLPKHGFARTPLWTLEETEEAGVVRLSLRDSEATRAIWPAHFLARLTVRIAGRVLSTSLTIENTWSQSFHFTAALHTYLRVDDIAQVEIAGLKGARYRVSGAPGMLAVDTGDVLRIAGELDRVYVNAPARLELREPGRQLVIVADNFPDAVIWNPGAEKAAALADMESGGERHMVCIEAGDIQAGVDLAPGAIWTAQQTLIASDYSTSDEMSEHEELLARTPAQSGPGDPRADLALKLKEMEAFVARAEASGEDLPPEAVEVVKHLREIMQALDGLTSELGG